MKKVLLLLMILAASAFAQVSEAIEVPYISYEIRTGKNNITLQANCLTCHSFGYITNQGPQSKAFWKGKVDKMIVHFKAPISDEDASIITEYLYTYYGNGKLK